MGGKGASDGTREYRYHSCMSVRAPHPHVVVSTHMLALSRGGIFGDLHGDHVGTQDIGWDTPFPLIPGEVPSILFLWAPSLAGCPLA